jgi:hypothetical protein
MECKRWETDGLLFTSGELGDQKVLSYNEHLKDCDYCRSELAFYSEGRDSFFKPEMFELQPSKKSDIALQHIGTMAPKVVASPLVSFNRFFRKGATVALLLLIGVSAPVYFTMVKNDSVNNHVATIEKNVISNSVDSLNDSTKIDSIKEFNTPGNLEMNGVVPVELNGD